MTDAPLHHRLCATLEERCQGVMDEADPATLEDIKKAAFPERNVMELQKLRDALDELYAHAMHTDKAQLGIFCLFIYLDVRKRCAQVGLHE
jgi:hypothetical protein